MRDIAQAAGVSVGNLYNHFTGKEALIGEIALLENGVFTEFAAGLRADKSGRSRRCRHFTAYHAFVAEPANVQLSAGSWRRWHAPRRWPSRSALTSGS